MQRTYLTIDPSLTEENESLLSTTSSPSRSQSSPHSIESIGFHFNTFEVIVTNGPLLLLQTAQTLHFHPDSPHDENVESNGRPPVSGHASIFRSLLNSAGHAHAEQHDQENKSAQEANSSLRETAFAGRGFRLGDISDKTYPSTDATFQERPPRDVVLQPATYPRSGFTPFTGPAFQLRHLTTFSQSAKTTTGQPVEETKQALEEPLTPQPAQPQPAPRQPARAEPEEVRTTCQCRLM